MGAVHDVIRACPILLELFETLTLGMLQEASSLNFLTLCDMQDAFCAIRERLGRETVVHRYVDGTPVHAATFQELQARGMPHWDEG